MPLFQQKQNKTKQAQNNENNQATLKPHYTDGLHAFIWVTNRASLTGMLFNFKNCDREDRTLMDTFEFGFNFVEYYNRIYLLQYSVAHLSIRKKFKILYPSP